MEYSEILKNLAPCGLNCGACVAFEGGPVQQNAAGLKRGLGDNFAPWAERFTGMNPVFANFPQFSELLDFLASGSCTGCRGAGCLFTACKVGPCTREMKVDFCFECDEFPCDRHGMPEAIEPRWRKNNEIMKEKGVAEYWELVKSRPRYP